MSDEIKLTLDTVGLMCPEPLFQTRNKLDELEIGEVLEVWADDPASEEDLKRFTKRMGNQLLLFEKVDNQFHFLIKKLK